MPSLEANLSRRWACVLSLDAVGFSRLMAQDDMAAVQAVRRCRRIVETHVVISGGRLFGAAGDSFMAEFPDAEGGLRCAVAIQKEIPGAAAEQQLLLRGGIDAGSVIDDGNLYGDVVNVAARLQEVCPPGGVLVSRAIYDALAIRGNRRSAGELSLKNIVAPVEIFEVMEGDYPLGASAGDLAAIDVTRSVPGFEGAPVLAILPLENLSGDRGLEHVCRGFSEDLINALSRMRQFAVIDRSSTFTHVSHHPSAQALGRRLGARYLLEGALRADADRFGVSMQLNDLESGRPIWSDRVEQEDDDFLPTLDVASLRISATLGGRIAQAEGARFRARRESRVGVRGLLWRSRWHLDQLTRRDAYEASRLLQEAERRDPDDPEVLIQLAHWHWRAGSEPKA